MKSKNRFLVHLPVAFSRNTICTKYLYLYYVSISILSTTIALQCDTFR